MCDLTYLVDMPYDPDNLPEDPIRRIEAIMALLRGPEGCPWDREQDHRTLRAHLLEEAYEVLEVLDEDPIDDDALRDELGDLLLQVVYHAQIAAESDRFDLDAVAGAISAKLIRRHPHVFENTVVEGSEEVLRNWESLKRDEGNPSALSGVPPVLPALVRASRVMGKAERAGFRWSDSAGALSKVEEEWQELQSASGDPEHAGDELGDLLLALVTFAHHLGVDAEASLRNAIGRFEDRFRRMEAEVESGGGRIDGLPSEDLLELWEAARSAGVQEGGEDAAP